MLRRVLLIFQFSGWLLGATIGLSLPDMVQGQGLGLYPNGALNSDYDMLSNAEELVNGTNPYLTDTDGDYIVDSDEILITGTNPLLADSDQNGFSDYEDWVTSNPQLWDVNKNALWDERDLQTNDYSAFLEHFWWPTSLLTDYDGDGICDRDEVLYGNINRFNYRNADSDADGIPDGDEWNGPNRWDPTDYDHDGLSATQEAGWPSSDPNNPDTDGDGLTDGADRYFGDPRYADADGDGLTDYFELIHNSYPYHGNYDEDNLSDALEIAIGTNPVAYDSDMDGIDDGSEYYGWTFLLNQGTDPTKIDSDGDFLTDWEEISSWYSGNWALFPQMYLDPNNPDTDGDGLLDYQEVNLTDSDGGGIPNVFERYYGLNPNLAADDLGDLDNDGETNLAEYLAGQLLDGNYGPHYDWDRDGMTNVWEMAQGLDPTDPLDAYDDPDADFLFNIEEFQARSDPREYLSPNAQAVSIQVIDPITQQTTSRLATSDYEAVYQVPLPVGLVRGTGSVSGREYDDDWDGDGLSNYSEACAAPPTDPRAPDLTDDDGDGLPTFWELLRALNPANGDQDGNGISDGDDDFDDDELTNLEELQSGTDPLNSDTDGDGLHDGWEISMSLNPANGDQNGNGISDGEDEFDDDELTNLEELQSGTDPLNADTDGDGLPDGWESSSGLDPLDPTGVNGSNGDFDGDSLTNIQEFQSGSSPQSDDADNDGLKDAEEVKLGTNPNKADSDDDQVPDNEDGWPLDQALFFPNLPEVQYVVIELPEHLVSLRNVSNDGVVFGYSTTNWDPGIWENGTWTLLPDATEEHEYYSWSGMNRQGAVVGQHKRGKFSSLGDFIGYEGKVIVYNQGGISEFPPYYAHLPSNLDYAETQVYHPTDLGLVIANDGSVYACSDVYGYVTRQLPDDSFTHAYYHYFGVDKRTPTNTSPLDQTFIKITVIDLESWQEPAPSVTIPHTLYAANSHGIVLARELVKYEETPWGIPLEGDDSMILDNGSQYLLKNVPGSEPNPSAPNWNVAYTVTDSASDPIIAGESNGRLALWAKRPGWKRIYHPDAEGSKIDGIPFQMNIHGQILGRGFVSPNQPNLVGELIHNGRVVNLSERNSTHDIVGTVDISDTGIILAYANRKNDPNPPTDPSLGQKCLLLPFDIEGHKRGTISSPGAKVSKGSGEYGQETVMMENADSEDNATQPDYATTAVDAANDDDLVKVVLHWPKDMKINRAKLELKHIGMEVDPTKTADADKYKETGPSRLNFYKPDGTKLTDADLKIDNLGSPGSSYLAEVLTTGELTLFIEGAEKFGMVGNDPKSTSAAKKLGGAMLKFEFTYNGNTSRARLLVYRGGFVLFRQPSGQPGGLGTFEFRDGKGRVTDTQTDNGNVLMSWSARSGKTTGANYNVGGGNGHIPPGWRVVFERTDLTNAQKDSSSGTGRNKKIKQGGYVRWKQDDETDPANRYTVNYLYDASKDKDYGIGEPDAIAFKFQTEVIPPTSAANRSEIQIHPDGKKDGTAGCIGIQTFQGCKDASKLFRRYHALKLKTEIQ